MLRIYVHTDQHTLHRILQGTHNNNIRKCVKIAIPTWSRYDALSGKHNTS